MPTTTKAAKTPFFDPQEWPLIQNVLQQKRFYLLAAVCTSWVFVTYPVWGQGLALTFLGVCLLLLSMVDLKAMILPDRIILPLLAVSFFLPALFLEIGWVNSLLGGVFAFVLFAGIYFGFLWLKGKPAMGFGDVKLLTILGLWVGALNLPLVLLLASLSALVAVIIRNMVHKINGDVPMPFGPFLAMGGWLTALYGPVFWLYFLYLHQKLTGAL